MVGVDETPKHKEEKALKLLGKKTSEETEVLVIINLHHQ